MHPRFNRHGTIPWYFGCSQDPSGAGRNRISHRVGAPDAATADPDDLGESAWLQLSHVRRSVHHAVHGQRLRTTEHAGRALNPRFENIGILERIYGEPGYVLSSAHNGAAVSAVQQALVDLGYSLPTYGCRRETWVLKPRVLSARFKRVKAWVSMVLSGTTPSRRSIVRRRECPTPSASTAPPALDLPSQVDPASTEVVIDPQANWLTLPMQDRFAGSASLQSLYNGSITSLENPNRATTTLVQQALIDVGYSLPVYGVDGDTLVMKRELRSVSSSRPAGLRQLGCWTSDDLFHAQR